MNSNTKIENNKPLYEHTAKVRFVDFVYDQCVSASKSSYVPFLDKLNYTKLMEFLYPEYYSGKEDKNT
jgi:hypothetical protein